MRIGRAFAIGAAVVVLGGCGSDDPAQTGRRDEATEWYLRSISSDDGTIAFVYTITGVASQCEREGRTSVDESDDEVAIVAYKSVTLDRNRACTEELGYVEQSVRLDRPLGDRALTGCRPDKIEASEDRICRDLERSRSAGIFELPTPPPSG